MLLRELIFLAGVPGTRCLRNFLNLFVYLLDTATKEPEFKIMAALHRWTKPEDIVAFFLSRFGDRSFLNLSTAAIARILSERPLPDGSRAVPITEGSLLYRIGNFNYLCGEPGWSNYAQLSRNVDEEYKNASIVELRSLVIQILGITVKDSVERRFEDFCRRFLKPKTPTK
jgi:hypothetical protein